MVDVAVVGPDKTTISMDCFLVDSRSPAMSKSRCFYNPEVSVERATEVKTDSTGSHVNSNHMSWKIETIMK